MTRSWKSRRAWCLRVYARFVLCPAKRLTHYKKGYYRPPSKPIFVPGLHGIGLLRAGSQQALRANHARLFALVDFQRASDQLASRRKLSPLTLHGQALGVLLDPYF